MKKFLAFIVTIVVMIPLFLTSCSDPGKTEKFSGNTKSDSLKFVPPIVNGDTFELYKYYTDEGGSFVWFAVNKTNHQSNLTYRVGKHDETVIVINGDPFRRVKGSVVMENDSLVLIKKSK